jgi:hypothetical protein
LDGLPVGRVFTEVMQAIPYLKHFPARVRTDGNTWV